MANELFKNFPEVKYQLQNGRIVTIKDFFRKAKLQGESLNQLIEYSKYELTEGERPDVVATKLYGNGDLHWTIFLVNEITNYYDWYMDTRTFENYMADKYNGQILVSTDSTDIVSSTSKFLIGEDITQGTVKGKVLRVDPTFNRLWVEPTNGTKFVKNQAVTGANSTKSFTPTSVKNAQDGVAYYYDQDNIPAKLRYNNVPAGRNFFPRTFWEKEYDDNEERRKIKVIKPQFIRKVVSEFERIMSA